MVEGLASFRRWARVALGMRRRFGARGFVGIVAGFSVMLSAIITGTLISIAGVEPDMVIPSMVISVVVPLVVAPAVSYLVVNLLEQLEEANARLSLMVGTDVLTGLANRRGFFDVAESVFQPGSDSRPLLVGMVDLDDFKSINDKFGHHHGDAALRLIGARLADMVGTDGIAGRLGGDEFAVLYWGERNLDDLDGYLRTNCVDVACGPAIVSASAGLAIAQPGDSVDLALARSDAELYRRKSERRRAKDATALTAGASSDETAGASLRR